MRAALIEELGQPPRLGEAAPPERRDRQALVEITAAPINPVDLSIAAGGFYTGDPELPYVPGVEGFGRVLEARSLAPGTRVYVTTDGGRGGPGSLTKRVAVDESALTTAPDGLDDSLAACFGVAGLAAWLPPAIGRGSSGRARSAPMRPSTSRRARTPTTSPRRFVTPQAARVST